MVERDPLRRQGRVIFLTFVTTLERLEKIMDVHTIFYPG